MTGRQDRQYVDHPLPPLRSDGEELLPFTDDRTHRSAPEQCRERIK
jgi:hypothetical protein